MDFAKSEILEIFRIGIFIFVILKLNLTTRLKIHPAKNVKHEWIDHRNNSQQQGLQSTGKLMKYTVRGNAVNLRFLITWYIGIFIYFLNHWKFHGQGSNQNWGTINLRKCWNDFTFDNQFIWRNWYVCHQESVENKKFKWQDKNGFLNLSPESVPKPTT